MSDWLQTLPTSFFPYLIKIMKIWSQLGIKQHNPYIGVMVFKQDGSVSIVPLQKNGEHENEDANQYETEAVQVTNFEQEMSSMRAVIEELKIKSDTQAIIGQILAQTSNVDCFIARFGSLHAAGIADEKFDEFID